LPQVPASTANTAVTSNAPTVRRFTLWLVVLTLAALAWRLGYVWHEQHRLLGGDGLSYFQQARAVAAGKGFLNPFNGRNDAIHPPAWTLILTGLALLGGRALLDMQLLAAVIGAAAVPLVGLVGRKVAGARTGLLAAAIAALYPGLWRYERALLSESLLLPLIALTLLLAYRFRERPGLARAAGLGVMCGLLASTRAEQILIAPFVVVPLIWWAREPASGERIDVRDRIRWLAAAGAVTVVLLTPWFAYNLGRFDSPVLLSNGFSGATGVSNCNETYYGPKTGYYDMGCLVRERRDHQKVAFIGDHLGRLPVVLAAREGRAFGVWAPFQQVDLDKSWERSARWVHLGALYGYWILVLPAVAGATILRRRRVPIYPMMGFVLTVVIAVAITFGEPRYRVPAEIPIVVCAAVAIDALLRRWWPSGAPEASHHRSSPDDPSPDDSGHPDTGPYRHHERPVEPTPPLTFDQAPPAVGDRR